MTTATTSTTEPGQTRLRLGSAIMAVGGLGFVGYAVIFFVRNFTDSFLELGIGPDQVDVGRSQIEDFSPELLHYISHLHIAISGFIAATGIAVAALSWYGVRRGLIWAWVTAVAVPVVALAVALPAHYPWGFDTIGHLGLIYLDTLLFVAGAGVAYLGLRDRPSA
ncbi:MAG: hypothetical protein M3237_00055 [Actinomycetota bacterium]|nr:hypothetical protein [Actinomycetota bacterium]